MYFNLFYKFTYIKKLEESFIYIKFADISKVCYTADYDCQQTSISGDSCKNFLKRFYNNLISFQRVRLVRFRINVLKYIYSTSVCVIVVLKSLLLMH